MQKKNNSETQTKIRSTKWKDNADTSSVQFNSTSITIEKGSENPQKATHHLHEKPLKVSRKDHRISPAGSISSHKDMPENPKIEQDTSKNLVKKDPENGTSHTEGAMRRRSERRGEKHDPVTHAPGIGVTGSGVTHYPGSGVKHDPGNGATSDQGSDVGHETKAGETLGTESNATPIPKNESAEPVKNTERVSSQVLNSLKRVPDDPHKQSSQLLITSERSTTELNQGDLKITKSSGTPHRNDVKASNFSSYFILSFHTSAEKHSMF